MPSKFVVSFLYGFSDDCPFHSSSMVFSLLATRVITLLPIFEKLTHSPGSTSYLNFK